MENKFKIIYKLPKLLVFIALVLNIFPHIADIIEYGISPFVKEEIKKLNIDIILPLFYDLVFIVLCIIFIIFINKNNRECYPKNDGIKSGEPLIRKRANKEMVRSTMRTLRETIHVLRLNRPNQCR